MIKNTIPEEYLRYQPRDTTLINYPYNWQVLYKEEERLIVARRANLFQRKFFIIAVLITSLASLVWFPLVNLLPLSPCSRSETVVLANVAGVFIFLLMLAGLNLVPAWAYLQNATDWREPVAPVRFRYSIDSGTFFFSRENVQYQKNDIKRVIVGEIQGYDTTLLIHPRDTDRVFSRKLLAQCVILIQDHDEQWHRHDLSLDLCYWLDEAKGSKPFIKLAELLEPLVECEVIIKRQTFNECYRQQRDGDGNVIVPTSDKTLW
jgi:hypothetical protein